MPPARAETRPATIENHVGSTMLDLHNHVNTWPGPAVGFNTLPYPTLHTTQRRLSDMSIEKSSRQGQHAVREPCAHLLCESNFDVLKG